MQRGAQLQGGRGRNFGSRGDAETRRRGGAEVQRVCKDTLPRRGRAGDGGAKPSGHASAPPWNPHPNPSPTGRGFQTAHSAAASDRDFLALGITGVMITLLPDRRNRTRLMFSGNSSSFGISNACWPLDLKSWTVKIMSTDWSSGCARSMDWVRIGHCSYRFKKLDGMCNFHLHRNSYSV